MAKRGNVRPSRARRRLRALVAAACVAALAPLGPGSASATAGAAGATGAATTVGTALAGGTGAHRNPGAYSNPLRPRIPGDGVVESCADPNVIKGQAGDRYWYLYCTTDPLNDADKNAAGEFTFHHVPMLRSLDLVHWTYLGDALPGLPEMAAPGAGFWAPDVVYSATYRRYYMFFVVTDTTAAAGGSDACATDNAIGVATSRSPAGPWTASPDLAVGPRPGPGGGCDYLWTFDPDVLGTRIGTSSILYYGSYYGGVFGTRLTLTATGATADAADATMVTIDNRYEGTNVVRRGGWYYLFASATNCCNGPLTGYSVFAGRSRNPLGPFVDREGVSLLDPYVGGTPVISMNGNRWVGTGHNTVFRDYAGQWWTIYHAVDRTDPYFAGAPGFTKRPALLDAIDWIGGWPTVNGGRWASDRRMPAPAAQPGQQSHHRVRLVAAQRLGRVVPSATDGFAGSTLADRWSWVRPPDPATYRVHDGVLSWRTQAGDLFVDSNDASVLTERAPRRDYVVEAKVRLDIPDEGIFNYVQGGVVIYDDDDNFVKLAAKVSIWNTRQTEFAKELAPVPEGWPRYGNTVVGPPSRAWTYVRIAVTHLRGRQRALAGGDTEAYTAYTSRDGARWVRGGTWTHTLGTDARIGLFSMGGTGFTTDFDYVRVSRLRHAPRR